MKKFTPIAMRCSQKQWDKIKDRINLPIQLNSNDFETYCWMTNDRNQERVVANLTSPNNVGYDRTVYETFNAKIFLEACGIEFYEYKITKETVLSLHRHGHDLTKTQLKDEFPECFKKELIVGRWYKSGDINDKFLFFPLEIKDSNHIKAYGFDRKGIYSESNNKFEWGTPNSLQEATPKEVEEALISEIKKRYTDKLVKPLNENIMCNYDGKGVKPNFRNIHLDSKNRIWSGCNGIWQVILFDNGTWATIINKKKMTISEIEEKLGHGVEVVMEFNVKGTI